VVRAVFRRRRGWTFYLRGQQLGAGGWIFWSLNFVTTVPRALRMGVEVADLAGRIVRSWQRIGLHAPASRRISSPRHPRAIGRKIATGEWRAGQDANIFVPPSRFYPVTTEWGVLHYGGHKNANALKMVAGDLEYGRESHRR
jgi:hypothetical protein